MGGSSDIFKMINRDELSHVRLYQKLLQELLEQEPQLESTIYRMMDEAVKAESEWVEYIIGENILGLPISALKEYIKYLANTRLKALGLKPLYENASNKFKHLEKIADTGKDAHVKTNFFDGTVTSYQMSSTLKGWDDF
jgi:ribonucleoside-diphosphate reductase beta chain